MSANEREIHINGQKYVVRVGEDGVELRKGDEGWPKQYLLYDNLRVLLETKNAAFKEHGDFDKANHAWQKEIVRRIKRNMPKARGKSA